MNQKTQYRASYLIAVVGALVVFVLVNVLGSLIADKFPATHVDFTKNGVYTIGETTQSVLQDLDESGKQLTIYYLKNTQDEITYVREIVLQYLGASKNLSYEAKYYMKDPSFMKPYGETATTLTEGSLIVDYNQGERYRIITYEEMYELAYSQSSGGYEVTGAALESKLTNAIAYCLSDEDVHVYLTSGHGEADPSEMAAVLQTENVIAQQLELTKQDVPEDCEILFVMSPVYDFTAAEIERLDAYLERGGNVQLGVEPAVDLPRLFSYLKEWGVTLNDDQVIETNPQYMSQDAQSGLYYIFPQVSEHPYTKTITEKSLNVMNLLCRSITLEDLDNVEYQVLFYTTNQGLSQSMDNSETKEGSFNLTYVLSKQVGAAYDKTATMVVSGNTSLWGLTNYSDYLSLGGMLSEQGLGNNAFFVDSVREMTNLRGSALSIDAKNLRVTRLVMTEQQQKLYRALFCFAMPILIFLIGIAVWLRRRHL